MKKITLLLLLISTLGFSQTDSLKLKSTRDAVHLREIPRSNLVVDFGVTQPTGDYAQISRAGLNISAEYLYYTNKHLGLGISLRHQYNEFGYLDFQNNDSTNATSNSYTNTSIAIGPTYSYTKRRFQLDLFVKGGVAFLNTPENNISEIGFGNIQVFSNDPENDSSSTAYLEGGLRLNYYFRRSVQVFFSPQYNTTLGNSIAYIFRDDTSIAPIKPNVSNKINASNLIFNVGIKIAIGKEYSSGEWREDD